MRVYDILILIANIKRLLIASLGKYVHQLECSCIVFDRENSTTTLENSLVISYRINHTVM